MGSVLLCDKEPWGERMVVGVEPASGGELQFVNQASAQPFPARSLRTSLARGLQEQGGFRHNEFPHTRPFEPSEQPRSTLVPRSFRAALQNELHEHNSTKTSHLLQTLTSIPSFTTVAIGSNPHSAHAIGFDSPRNFNLASPISMNSINATPINTQRYIHPQTQLQYQGLLKGTVPHGEGTVRDPSTNQQFRGLFNEGQLVQGLLCIKDSPQCYEGAFLNGLYHGQGLLSSSEGFYRGSFQHGKKEGRGVFKWKVGRKYVGEYHNDKKQGYGELYNTDGSLCYKGMFQNDMPNGEGTGFVQGRQYTGIWRNGQLKKKCEPSSNTH